jgi:hypothetical protein
MGGVKTCATLDKENVRKVYLKKKTTKREYQKQLIILRLLVRQTMKDLGH